MTMLSFNHACYKTDETGRFEIHKSLHFGCRGPAGSEYIAHDTTGQAPDSYFQNLTLVKCWIAKHRDGLQCSPWFGHRATGGNVKQHQIKLVPHPEWKEIKG